MSLITELTENKININEDTEEKNGSLRGRRYSYPKRCSLKEILQLEQTCKETLSSLRKNPQSAPYLNSLLTQTEEQPFNPHRISIQAYQTLYARMTTIMGKLGLIDTETFKRMDGDQRVFDPQLYLEYANIIQNATISYDALVNEILPSLNCNQTGFPHSFYANLNFKLDLQKSQLDYLPLIVIGQKFPAIREISAANSSSLTDDMLCLLPKRVSALHLQWCDQLTGTFDWNLPKGMTVLSATNCLKLEKLPNLPEGLRELNLRGCLNLKKECLSKLPPNLTKLDLSNCPKIPIPLRKSLEGQELQEALYKKIAK